METRKGVPIYYHVHELALIVMGLGEESGFFNYVLTGKEEEWEKVEKLEKVIPTETDDDDVREKKITTIYNRFYKELGISDKAKEYKGVLEILNARGIFAMSKALRDTSNYTLKPIHSNWKAIEHNVNIDELPAVSLRRGGWIKYKSLSWHHRTIVGVWQGCYEYKHKFFCKKIRSTYGYENWYLMADGGNDGKPKDKNLFWEEARNPYQVMIGLVTKYSK